MIACACEDTLALAGRLAGQVRDECPAPGLVAAKVYIKEGGDCGLHSVRVVSSLAFLAFAAYLLLYVCCYYYHLLHLLLEKLRASFCLLLLGCLTVVNPPSALVLSCETTRLTSALLCASRDVYGPAACATIIKFPEACTSAFSDCRKR